MRVPPRRLSAVLCAALLCLSARSGIAATDTAVTFTRKCTSCHTFGHGVLIGPDLKGATDRHTREWLVAWIGSSESLIRGGDPAAIALFNRFKRQRMPDQSLTSAELSALVDYLASGGPDADALKRLRRVDTATAAEIELGRGLFVGQRALANGGAACFSCHRLGAAASAGGSLGPDLSGAYARYRDRGMTELLAGGCFPRARPSLALTPSRASLTDDESFALRAFLRRATTVER